MPVCDVVCGLLSSDRLVHVSVERGKRGWELRNFLVVEESKCSYDNTRERERERERERGRERERERERQRERECVCV